MRKTEQKLWDRMRKNLAGQSILLERMENLVGVGIPDVQALVEGCVTWCELKAVDHPPARPTTPLLGNAKGLSVDQRNWHLRWRQHGGASLIIIGVGSDDLFVVDGEYADIVNGMTVDIMSQAACARSWKELAAELGVKK